VNKWVKRAKRTSTTFKTTKQTMKKALDPPIIDDDVVLSKDNDIWAIFDDDFDGGQRANVIVSIVLPPLTLCILLLGLLDLTWHRLAL
jgi:hypothetical protein